MANTTTGVKETQNSGRREGRLFYGWWIVIVSSFQGMAGNGIISSGFPVFFDPIKQSMALSSTQMSAVFSLARAEGGLGGPAVGWLVDRFGARPMIFFGGLSAGIGMILLSRATEYWQLLLLFAGLVSVGKTAGLGQTLMATVNQWFIRRKALALSILMTSFAGGGAIVVPLLGMGIANIGWRDTLLYAGIFIILVTVPVSYLIRSKPEDMGLLPDGDVDPTIAPADRRSGGHGRHAVSNRAVTEQDFTVRQTIKTSAFWFLLAGVVTRVAATNAIIVHLFPLLRDHGLSLQTASFYAAVMFFLAIPLRFGLGVAGGKFSGRKLLFGGMNLGALGLLALLVIPGPAGIAIFVIGIAVVEGVTSVNWILVGEYFGRSRFASLMGFMSVFHNIGLAISPIFAGWIKDQTGSYDLALIAFIPLFIVSAFMFALARKPTRPIAADAGQNPTLTA